MRSFDFKNLYKKKGTKRNVPNITHIVPLKFSRSLFVLGNLNIAGSILSPILDIPKLLNIYSDINQGDNIIKNIIRDIIKAL